MSSPWSHNCFAFNRVKSIFDAVCKYKKMTSPINIICREDLCEDLKACYYYLEVDKCFHYLMMLKTWSLL